MLGSTVWHARAGTLPQAETMGIVGVLALLANLGVAMMLGMTGTTATQHIAISALFLEHQG